MSPSFQLKPFDLFRVQGFACFVILNLLVTGHFSSCLDLTFFNRRMNDQEIFVLLCAADMRSIPLCPVLLNFKVKVLRRGLVL